VVLKTPRVSSTAVLFCILNVCACEGSITPQAPDVTSPDAGVFSQTATTSNSPATGAESHTREIPATEADPGGLPTPPDDATGASAIPTSAPEPAPGEEAICSENSLGPRRRLLRLTEQQFLRSISDLLGQTFVAPVDFADEQVVAGFQLGAGVDTTLALHWWTSVDAAASEIEKNNDTYLQRYAECTLAEEPEMCVGRFVKNFGRMAYRRPLQPTELEALTEFYEESVDAGNTPVEALGATVRVLLMSPDFTHRVEIAATGKHQVDDFELATRLSFLLWGTIPDDELLDVAESGTLAQSDVLKEQVDRMLADNKARAAMREFGRQWLDLDADTVASFDPSLLEFDIASYGASHEAATYIISGQSAPVPDVMSDAGVIRWELDATLIPQGTESLTIRISAPKGSARARLSINGTVSTSGVEIAGEELTLVQAPLDDSEEPTVVELELSELEASTEVHLDSLTLKARADAFELSSQLLDQALTFVEEQAFNGTFSELLTSASHPPLRTYSALFAADGKGDTAKGLLTLPSLLMSHGGLYSGGTSPIKRGLWLMERILCMQPPPPLPQLPDYCLQECESNDDCAELEQCLQGTCVSNNATPCSDGDSCSPVQVCLEEQCVPNPDFCIPPRLPTQTTREWWDSFGSQCHGCHRSINGLGYALEDYDGLGKFRTTEETAAGPKHINAKGQLQIAAEVVTFEGAKELTQLVDEASLAASCFVDSAFTYAYSQVPTGHSGAQCALHNLRSEFPDMHFRPLQVFRAIALSEAFRLVGEED
jgi:hypothetical protein